MTKKETVSIVRVMGLTCIWSTEWQVFRINYRSNDSRYRGDDRSYESDDSLDIIGAARYMINFKDEA
jgi:hypothetical protein